MSPSPDEAPVEPAPLPAAAPPVVYGAKRAIVIFIVFWAVQLVAVIGLVILAAVIAVAKGQPLATFGARVTEGPILLGIMLLGTIIAMFPLLRMLRRTGHAISPAAPLAMIGWAPASARACASAAGQGVAVVVAFLLVSRFLPESPHTLGPLTRAAQAGGWSRALWAAYAVLVAPPSEELLFRGVLYSGLARSWRPAVAAVVTTLLFTSFHVTEIRGYWPAWVQIGTMGALALRARVRSGSLVPGLALHTSYNLALVLLTYAFATSR